MKGRYAFVEFDKAEDAENAIRNTDGINFHGYEIKVELAKPKDARRERRGGRYGDYGPSYRSRGMNDHRGRLQRSRSRSPPRNYGRGRDRSDSGTRGPYRSKELREGLCFVCKERGHLKRDCPILNRRGPPPRRGYRRYSRSRSPPPRRYSRSRSPPRRYSRSRSPPRRYSRSRSPPRNQYRERDYSPQRRSSPPRRSPERRRHYSRSRSPPRHMNRY